jgi:hypothetical protein
VATDGVRKASWVSAAPNGQTECQRVRRERPRGCEDRTAVARKVCSWRRASDSPMSGECRVSRTRVNAARGSSGWTASETGLRSDADERPGQTENHGTLDSRMWRGECGVRSVGRRNVRSALFDRGSRGGIRRCRNRSDAAERLGGIGDLLHIIFPSQRGFAKEWTSRSCKRQDCTHRW